MNLIKLFELHNLTYRICAQNHEVSSKNLKPEIFEEAKKIANAEGLNNLAFLKQTHSNKVVFTDKPTVNAIEADALVTDQKGLGLGILHADCQCAFMFDPKKKLIGAVHAGFRGLFEGIYENTLEVFNRYGSDIDEIFVYIGPSLGLKHSEFKSYLDEFPTKFHSYRDDFNRFDLKQIAKDILIKSGVNPNKIQISTECTYDNSNYFSYRRSKKKCLEQIEFRNFSFIGQKS